MITHDFDTIIGNIPKEWKPAQLRTLLSEHVAGDWGDEHGEIAIKVLRSTNFTSAGHLDFSDVAVRCFSQTQASRFGIRNGDILLERSGGGPDQPVGRVGLIESNLEGYWVSNFVQILRPNQELVHPRYLGWVLFELQRTGVVERFQQQSTQMRNLNYRDYLRMLIPLPPMKIQESIAGAIDSAATTIAHLIVEQESAQRVKDSMLQQLLVGALIGGGNA